MILRDARVLVGGYDLSGDHNEVTLTIGVVELDGTRFGDLAARVEAGLATVEATGKGFVRLGAGGTNSVLRGNLGVANVPVTILSGDPAGPDPVAVETFLAEFVSYEAGAAVGQLLAFTWTAKGQGYPSEAGSDLTSAPITANGVSETKTITLTKDEALALTLHVTAVQGTNPTLDVIVESDATAGFQSPALRATFPTVSAPGAWAQTVTGKQNDDGFWRARWTVGGTAPAFTVALVVGSRVAIAAVE